MNSSKLYILPCVVWNTAYVLNADKWFLTQLGLEASKWWCGTLMCLLAEVVWHWGCCMCFCICIRIFANAMSAAWAWAGLKGGALINWFCCLRHWQGFAYFLVYILGLTSSEQSFLPAPKKVVEDKACL